MTSDSALRTSHVLSLGDRSVSDGLLGTSTEFDAKIGLAVGPVGGRQKDIKSAVFECSVVSPFYSGFLMQIFQ